MGIYINLAFEREGWKTEKKSQFQLFIHTERDTLNTIITLFTDRETAI